MDEVLQHDPRTKQQIIDALHQHLYGPIMKQFRVRLDEIITKNCIFLGSADMSFTYRGEVYATVGGNIPRIHNRLSKHLVPFMDEYLNDERQLNNYELPYVMGFIRQVLNSSNYLHDYLHVLPSSVHRPVEQLITSCPCRSVRLTPEGIHELQQKNRVSINLMKQRMVTNLLI